MSATPTGGVRLACGAAVRRLRRLCARYGRTRRSCWPRHRGTAGGVGVAAGRRAGGGGHGGRIAARAAHRGAVGAAAAGGADRGERRPGAAVGGCRGRPDAWPTWSWRGRGRWPSCAPGGVPRSPRCGPLGLAEVDPALASRVSAYRAGFLPEERRALEAALDSGELLGVARRTRWSWYRHHRAGRGAGRRVPGTRASFWQQAGRAGRAGREAWSCWWPATTRWTPTWCTTRRLCSAAVESCVLDPTNPYVLAPQLACAAAESPITEAEVASVFGGARARAVLDALTADGVLRRRPAGWFWPLPSSGRRPGVDIRGSGAGSGRRGGGHRPDAGHLDMATAPATLHPGAVHLHRGASFVVDELNLDDGSPWCTPRSRTGARPATAGPPRRATTVRADVAADPAPRRAPGEPVVQVRSSTTKRRPDAGARRRGAGWPARSPFRVPSIRPGPPPRRPLVRRPSPGCRPRPPAARTAVAEPTGRAPAQHPVGGQRVRTARARAPPNTDATSASVIRRLRPRRRPVAAPARTGSSDPARSFPPAARAEPPVVHQVGVQRVVAPQHDQRFPPARPARRLLPERRTRAREPGDQHRVQPMMSIPSSSASSRPPRAVPRVQRGLQRGRSSGRNPARTPTPREASAGSTSARSERPQRVTSAPRRERTKANVRAPSTTSRPASGRPRHPPTAAPGRRLAGQLLRSGGSHSATVRARPAIRPR